jgi:hypothetical protein
VADTAYSNAYVFPSNTWIEPGRFLLLGGSNVPNRDLEVNFRLPLGICSEYKRLCAKGHDGL